eukprot:5102170-Ditylum_brightwellii.AAC.1
MKALDVAIKWKGGADPKNPAKVANIFEKTGITKDQVKTQIDLIWADMAQGSTITPKYFKVFNTKTTNNGTLTTTQKPKKAQACDA